MTLGTTAARLRRASLRLPALLLALAACLALAPAARGQTVFVNELHYDNQGGDANEAVEVAGPAGTSLAGWSLVFYNGSNGNEYRTESLSGILPNQQSGFGTVSTGSLPSIQNGSPDGLALVNPSNTVVQFLSYEGTFTANDGPAAGLTSTDIGVQETGSTLATESLQLGGTGSTYADFAWQNPQANTFGAVNAGQTFVADATPPSLASATVNGTTLTLTYDETLDDGSVPAASVFTVTAGGAPVSVASVNIPTTSQDVVLTLGSAVAIG
jgi:hypothetical protein